MPGSATVTPLGLPRTFLYASIGRFLSARLQTKHILHQHIVMDSIRFAKPRSARTSPGIGDKLTPPRITMPTEFAFINNDNPDKIKDPKTRRTVRRHVMKDIGMSRRRGGCTPSSRTTPTHPLSPTIPSFVPYLDSWEDSQAASNVASIYLALDIVDEAVLRLCRTNIALNFLRQEPRAVNKLNMESDECLKVYTRSISFVRQTLLPGESLDESVSDAMLGTIVCLAFYDVSPQCVLTVSPFTDTGG